MSKKQPHPSASSDPAAQFFKGPAAAAYDERNRKLAPISENLHFLIRLILGDLPASARILCVGVGTGSEIIKLAGVYPDWTFTGVDPSADMLAVCRARMADENLASRVELCHGHLADLPESEPYDAVLCLLVTQFVKDSRERQAMFQGLAERVKSQGYLINAEISDDLESPKFLQLLEKWKGMIRLSGSTEEQLSNILPTWRRHVSVLPAGDIEDFLRASGFAMPVQFFQSFLIRAWYSQKD